MRPILHHYWLSSASWRVRWALAVKNLAFDSVMVDLRLGEQDAPAHRARSPIGAVPVLEVDGRCLTESVAIIEYLEQTVPEPPLYPAEPWARARVRQLVELVNAGIQPLQNPAVITRHSGDADEQRAFARHFNERGLAALEALLAQVDGELGRGRFAIGDALTAADLFLVPQLAAARRFGVDVARFPRLLEAETAARATPHAEAARPEHQPGAPK